MTTLQIPVAPSVNTARYALFFPLDREVELCSEVNLRFIEISFLLRITGNAVSTNVYASRSYVMSTQKGES